jgi:tripartite-type tricarboxylate transporter receptor subunit TctC
MTDRIKGFVVTLDKDIRIDDVQEIMNAIKMVKGVIDVSPSVANTDDHMNRERIAHEFRSKFWNFMQTELK